MSLPISQLKLTQPRGRLSDSGSENDWRLYFDRLHDAIPGVDEIMEAALILQEEDDIDPADPDILETAHGARWIQGSASEELTIAAAASTDTSANLLPANSIIEAAVCRVTVVIPTAVTFSVGDATQAARFATGVGVAANTTSVGIDHWNPTVAAASLGPQQAAAAAVRITPNIAPAAATGQVRITVFYRQFVAPIK